MDPGVLHKLTSLRTSGADDTVICDFETSIEGRCIVDVVAALHDKQWANALHSACLSLLVSGRVDRQTMKLRLAFQALSGGGWRVDEIDSVNVIQDSVFDLAKQAIRAAEHVRVLSAQEARFRQLDASRELSSKQFDELQRLADMLEANGVRLGPAVRFRLTREREAQQRLARIHEIMAALSYEIDHRTRMEKIRIEVWPLVTEAVDLAAGLHASYGREIAESVSAVEEVLSTAANATVMRQLTRDADEMCHVELASLRDSLRSERDVVQTLEAICRSFSALRETSAVDGVLEQARHWLKAKGRRSYYALIAKGDGHARNAVGRSRHLIERSRQDLPDELVSELLTFLAKFESRLVSVAPPQEPSQPVAEPLRLGVFARLWAMLGRYLL